MAGILEAHGHHVRIETIDPQAGFRRLACSFSLDGQDTPYQVSLLFANDFFEDGESTGDPKILQFNLPIPFQVNQSAVNETIRAILTLNPFLPIGAFGLIENDQMLYFYYSLVLSSRAPSVRVLTEVMNMIVFIADTIAPLLGEIASGRGKLEDALKALGQVGGPIPPELMPKR